MSSFSHANSLDLPPHGPVRPTHLDTTGESSSSNLLYTQQEQLDKVLHTMRLRDAKIAVISNAMDTHNYADCKTCATSIATELNKVLSGSKVLVYEYEIKNKSTWFEHLRDGQTTHFIFVNLPPYDPYCSNTREGEFFNQRSRRILEVVVVKERSLVTTPGGTRTTSYTPVHYLEKFQHLTGNPKDIASKALCHFAASQPIPHAADEVYWSELPKVHHIIKPTSNSPLGISIMTREMASKSLFPRIVLVKALTEDCVPALRNCIGRYTHIQSFNGILLDGLSISDATKIFQSSAHMPSIQLVVRYVHPSKALTHQPRLTGGAVTMRTPVTPIQEKTAADRIDPKHETLPIPLMILGDIHVRCKELFNRLSGSMTDSTSLLNVNDDADSQASGRSGSNTERNTQVSSATTTLHVPSRPTRSESSYDSREGSDVAEPAHFQSDKYVRRLSVSRAIFNDSGLSSPSTTPVRTGHAHPPSYNRQHTYPYVEKRYILNMFTQEMDRKFVHLFLRQSGIFLVVVSLEDMLADPVIQFENLSFWLRLVQTHVKPAGIRRVIIVGMSDTFVSSPEEQDCLLHLEGAIREAEFPHVFSRDGTSIINFNRSSPKASVDHLCSAIGKCMDAVMQRAFHFNRQFFDRVFQPFTGLTEVLIQMDRFSDTIVSAENLLAIYKNNDDNYFDTLAAHSSALVDGHDSLLKPGFLVDLLKKLSLTSDNYNDIFRHDIPQLKNLPIVLNPWPMAQIVDGHQQFTKNQQSSIMKWAERYELFYSLGYSGNHEVFFIPLLATEFLADDASYDWPEEDGDKEPWYTSQEATILYAKLNFSAIDSFFYLLLTELLKDVVNSVLHNPSKKCYINYGCLEAIMPVHVAEVNSSITVYLQYHLLHNVIEFRTNSRTRQQYLYQVAETKLKAAFKLSKYAGRDWEKAYKGAVTFNIPDTHYDPDLVSSSLGKLCGLRGAPSRPLSVSSCGAEDYDEEQQLLRMKRVTDREWLSASQDMKKRIPGDTFIKWGRRLSSEPDNWAMVASKLQLMSRDDVEFYRQNPQATGNGELVLNKWVNSSLTYKELTNTLRCEEVRLNLLADDIEGFFGTDV